MLQKIYPRSNDKETVYLKSVITNPNIIVGDYTMYNDFVKEPKDFEKNNVLYQIKPKSDYPLKTLYPRAFQTGQNNLIYYDITTVE